MNTTRTRASAALLALVLTLLAAFSVFAEGGDGSGGGDNQDKPLVLDSSSISDGAKDVDPNVRIVLHFTKNVVNQVVRENNMRCFTVSDSKGNVHPINVVMGDDQVDPSDTTKRTVTIVPKSPYKAGETYVLTISRDLAAKNGRDVLGEFVHIKFTVAGTAADTAGTSAYVTSPPYRSYNSGSGSSGSSDDTTTTTAPATTTTKPSTTAGRPPITAAKPTTTTAKSTESEKSTTETVIPALIPEPSEFTVEREATTAPVTVPYAVTTTAEPLLPTESFLPWETTEIFRMDYTAPVSETASETQAEQAADTQGKRVSPLLLLGIIIALAAAAAAVIAIVYKKEKKG